MKANEMTRKSLEEDFLDVAVDDVTSIDKDEYDQYFNTCRMDCYIVDEFDTEQQREEYYDLLEMEVDDWENLLNTADFNIDEEEDYIPGKQYHLDSYTVWYMIRLVHELEEHAQKVMDWRERRKAAETMTLDELSDYTGKTRKELVEEYTCRYRDEDESENCITEGTKYGYWDNSCDIYLGCYYNRFYFIKDEFTKGEWMQEKIEEDKQREEYIESIYQRITEERTEGDCVNVTGYPYGIRYHAAALVEAAEAQLEVDY